jgi:hypothetical protein
MKVYQWIGDLGVRDEVEIKITVDGIRLAFKEELNDREDYSNERAFLLAFNNILAFLNPEEKATIDRLLFGAAVRFEAIYTDPSAMVQI